MNYRKLFLIAFIALTSVLRVKAQEVRGVDFKDIEKRTIHSSDTVFVINFWATWCAPCVKELPYFERLAEKYKDKALKVILVSLDFKSKIQSDLVSFIKKHHLKSEVVVSANLDESFINTVDKSWSGAIPATLIVNHQKGVRKFYEQEFNFEELENVYLMSQ